MKRRRGKRELEVDVTGGWHGRGDIGLFNDTIDL
jgi:hypothetical protein